MNRLGEDSLANLALFSEYGRLAQAAPVVRTYVNCMFFPMYALDVIR